MPVPADIQRVDECVWDLPVTHRAVMRVPVRIFATKALLDAMYDAVFVQACHVSTLPGIVAHSLVIPPAHRGHGFTIGGVAAIIVLFRIIFQPDGASLKWGIFVALLGAAAIAAGQYLDRKGKI